MKKKGLSVLLALVLLVVAAGMIYDSKVYTDMPDLEGMRLDDAINTLEEARIIEDGSYEPEVSINDMATGDALELKDSDMKNYIVATQSPKAGSRFKFRTSLLGRGGCADVAILNVSANEET